jgi:uncharacterized protein YbjT (DUF2867 family)
MMILVVGATGLVGGDVSHLLASKQKAVRALVRSTSDPSKIGALRNHNIQTVPGDLKDRASLDAACRGANTIVSTASSTISRQEGDNLNSVDLQGQLDLIDAAYSAGVSHFVYVSFSQNVNVDSPLKNAKRTVEDYLVGSGLKYTILRPTFFMEIWLGPHTGFDFPNARASIYGTGNNKISWISFKDVARYLAASVDNEAAKNQVFELGGPQDLSPLEVVKIFEEASGRKFETNHVPEEILEQQRSSATDPMQITFAALMLSYAHGDQVDRTVARKAFPEIEPHSVRDYAQAVAGK